MVQHGSTPAQARQYMEIFKDVKPEHVTTLYDVVQNGVIHTDFSSGSAKSTHLQVTPKKAVEVYPYLESYQKGEDIIEKIDQDLSSRISDKKAREEEVNRQVSLVKSIQKGFEEKETENYTVHKIMETEGVSETSARETVRTLEKEGIDRSDIGAVQRLISDKTLVDTDEGRTILITKKRAVKAYEDYNTFRGQTDSEMKETILSTSGSPQNPTPK